MVSLTASSADWDRDWCAPGEVRASKKRRVTNLRTNTRIKKILEKNVTCVVVAAVP